MDTKQSKEHWNKVYTTKETNTLGWYEETPEESLKLIEKCKLSKDARILNVGAGATTLIDELVRLNYKNLIATDISESAIDVLKKRIGDAAANIEWVIDDLTQPAALKNIVNVNLWHDRAVLHFFLEETGRKNYFDLLKQLVVAGGYVIIATFNLDGATKCSGLPVYRYNEKMISDYLGSEFELIDSYNYLYHTPSGAERPYVYTLYRRMS